MRRIKKRKKTPKTLRYKRKSEESKKRMLKGISLLVSTTLIIIFFFGDHGVYQLIKINLERKKTQKLISELRVELQSLETEKQLLEQNDEYLLRLAREKYGMVLPGEKMFRVIEEKKDK